MAYFVSWHTLFLFRPNLNASSYFCSHWWVGVIWSHDEPRRVNSVAAVKDLGEYHPRIRRIGRAFIFACLLLIKSSVYLSSHCRIIAMQSLHGVLLTWVEKLNKTLVLSGIIIYQAYLTIVYVDLYRYVISLRQCIIPCPANRRYWVGLAEPWYSSYYWFSFLSSSLQLTSSTSNFLSYDRDYPVVSQADMAVSRNIAPLSYIVVVVIVSGYTRENIDKSIA